MDLENARLALTGYAITSVLFLLVVSVPMHAQDEVKGPAAAVPTSPATTTPRNLTLVNVLHGFNAAISFSGVHDSSLGWYTVATPAISYSFSHRYSADASISLYPSRMVVNGDASPSGEWPLSEVHGDPGDTLVAFHASFEPHQTQNTITLSATLPTGSQVDGLGLGITTVDLSNHSERYFGRNGVLLDVGLGDSSGLFNRLVMNQDRALAPIAHFQSGLVLLLPFQSYLQTTAYEQLPLGDQKLYTTSMDRGGPPRTFVTGRRVSEDNGFANVLTVPLTDHFTFASSYTRSLRLHLDTVSVGITYVWKGTGSRKLKLVDRALMEAERVVP